MCGIQLTLHYEDSTQLISRYETSTYLELYIEVEIHQKV